MQLLLESRQSLVVPEGLVSDLRALLLVVALAVNVNLALSPLLRTLRVSSLLQCRNFQEYRLF